jgi:GNAT superfamily N-acetyltransferase
MEKRIAPVEENLFAWRRVFLDVDGVHDYGAPDVEACVSDVAFHLFNGICAARFDDWRGRGERVADDYIQRGLPWFWWVTPSTTNPALEASLEARGAQRNDAPGMHLDLNGSAPSQAPDGLVLTVLASDESGAVEPLLDMFGFPDAFHQPMARHAQAFASAGGFTVHATSEGKTVAGGLALVSDGTVGLYLIATHPEHRNRGIGGAVTERLAAEGKRRGATAAVLHSSRLGFPVYRRLGFEHVCMTTQFVWYPEPA